LLTLSWPTLREGTAHEHHQALALTFDGTLIDEMSFQMLLSEDSSITKSCGEECHQTNVIWDAGR